MTDGLVLSEIGNSICIGRMLEFRHFNADSSADGMLACQEKIERWITQVRIDWEYTFEVLEVFKLEEYLTAVAGYGTDSGTELTDNVLALRALSTWLAD